MSPDISLETYLAQSYPCARISNSNMSTDISPETHQGFEDIATNDPSRKAMIFIVEWLHDEWDGLVLMFGADRLQSLAEFKDKFPSYLQKLDELTSLKQDEIKRIGQLKHHLQDEVNKQQRRLGDLDTKCAEKAVKLQKELETLETKVNLKKDAVKSLSSQIDEACRNLNDSEAQTVHRHRKLDTEHFEEEHIDPRLRKNTTQLPALDFENGGFTRRLPSMEHNLEVRDTMLATDKVHHAESMINIQTLNDNAVRTNQIVADLESSSDESSLRFEKLESIIIPELKTQRSAALDELGRVKEASRTADEEYQDQIQALQTELSSALQDARPRVILYRTNPDDKLALDTCKSEHDDLSKRFKELQGTCLRQEKQNQELEAKLESSKEDLRIDHEDLEHDKEIMQGELDDLISAKRKLEQEKANLVKQLDVCNCSNAKGSRKRSYSQISDFVPEEEQQAATELSPRSPREPSDEIFDATNPTRHVYSLEDVKADSFGEGLYPDTVVKKLKSQIRDWNGRRKDWIQSNARRCAHTWVGKHRAEWEQKYGCQPCLKKVYSALLSFGEQSRCFR